MNQLTIAIFNPGSCERLRRAGYASAHATQLYDCRRDDVSNEGRGRLRAEPPPLGSPEREGRQVP
jgi:hypothetical protein